MMSCANEEFARKVNLEHILQSFKGIDILGLSESYLTDQTLTELSLSEGIGICDRIVILMIN